MSKKEKLHASISTAPQNVSIDDLIKLMEGYGFTCRETREGYFVKHDKLGNKMMVSVPNPHGKGKSGKKVKRPYVLKCLKAIEFLSYEEEE